MQNNYVVIPGSSLLQPGLGIRPQPARLAAQDRDRADRCCCRSVKARSSSPTAASPTRCSAAGRSPAVAQFQSGFPDRRQPERERHRCSCSAARSRPNMVAGQRLPGGRRHHRPHHRRTRPTTCTSTWRRSRRWRRTSSATRRARCPASSRRGATTFSMSAAKNVQPARAVGAVRAHRSAQHVQHRAVGRSGELARSATRRSARSRTRRTTCGWCSSRCDSLTEILPALGFRLLASGRSASGMPASQAQSQRAGSPGPGARSLKEH